MKKYFYIVFTVLIAASCEKAETQEESQKQNGKPVIYQVFTRLFGNTNATNRPYGSIEENGVGKFDDFTDTALEEIHKMGVSHIWYTGVLHHATVTDYQQFGIQSDDPDVIKGRAGSPYAVKDYYQVDPDLAVDVNNRMEEFESLIARTHKHNMKVIIDIVPNHIARDYKGLNNPEGVVDFGAEDDKSVVYNKNNNFYYIPGQDFVVPVKNENPYGGLDLKGLDGYFTESPAKWTGNGSRLAQPSAYDWYETVKINYGVDPEGQNDFPSLPDGFETKSEEEHFLFWSDKQVPNSWVKFKDIALFWLDKGVDGFRFDMAEMVPVEFWSYMNSAIKHKNPNAFLLAEVYNPALYRDYLFKGKMDYLYDKVGLYDTLKAVIRDNINTEQITLTQNKVEDIQKHMLHFLENHDEQRLASKDFASSAEIGKPAMVVSTLISGSPTMIYFGQEVGEAGSEYAGFGKPTRTSIFDYIGVPEHQKWMNFGAFNGGKLSEEQRELRRFYSDLLNFSASNSALKGGYLDLHQYNTNQSEDYKSPLYSFARWSDSDLVITCVNFDKEKSFGFKFYLPDTLLKSFSLTPGSYEVVNVLNTSEVYTLVVEDSQAYVHLKLEPLQSIVLKLVK
jgi:glycosidase